MATWDDRDEESVDEEQVCEISNLALMAIRWTIWWAWWGKSNSFLYELVRTFQELHYDLKKMGSKNAFLRKENFSLFKWEWWFIKAKWGFEEWK